MERVHVLQLLCKLQWPALAVQLLARLAEVSCTSSQNLDEGRQKEGLVTTPYCIDVLLAIPET